MHAVCDPVRHHDGTHVAGLPFTDPRAQALLHILLMFRLQPNGFTNRDLRDLLADHLGRPPATITVGQATYDLRRLREHGLIARLPHTHRYEVTDTGLAHAAFLAHAHDRFLRTGLAHLHDQDQHHRSPPRPAPTRTPWTPSPDKPASPPDQRLTPQRSAGTRLQNPNMTRSFRLRRTKRG